MNTSLTVIVPGLREDERARDFWGISQLTLLLSTAFTILLGAVYPLARGRFLPAETSFGLYLIGIVVIPLACFQAVLHAQFVNNRDGRLYSFITAATSVIDLALLSAGCYFFRERGVLASAVVSQFVLCAWMTAVVLRKNKFVKLEVGRLSHLTEYYKYGFAIFAAGIGASLIDSGDRFVLARYVSAYDLGVYAAVYGLCSQLNQVATPLFSTLMPFVTAAVAEKDFAKARAYLEKSQRLLFFIYIPAIALFTITGPDLIRILATEKFLSGASIIPWVVIGTVLWQFHGIYSYHMHAHKRGSIMTRTILTGGAINLAFNLAFIPRYGIAAAAIATMVAYGFIFFVDRFYSNRIMEVKLRPLFIAKLAAISAVAFGPALFLNQALADAPAVARFIAVVASGGSLYMAFSYFFSLFDQAEVDSLVRSLKSFVQVRN